MVNISDELKEIYKEEGIPEPEFTEEEYEQIRKQIKDTEEIKIQLKPQRKIERTPGAFDIFTEADTILQKEIEILKSENENLQKEIEELRNKLQDAEETIEINKIETGDYTRHIDTLKSEIEKLNIIRNDTAEANQEKLEIEEYKNLLKKLKANCETSVEELSRAGYVLTYEVIEKLECMGI